MNKTPQSNAVEAIKTAAKLNRPTTATAEQEPLYDIEGLINDFPTARELEKFVFDETGYVLNLKGRSNKFKYETAMSVLNGAKPEDYMLGKENPYLDKTDLIPVDTLRTEFPRPAEVIGVPTVTFFQSSRFPDPDPEFKAAGQKCDTVFRKYANNVITYEIIGPVSARAVGTRVNKFGKEVPEKYTWIDPRTGEQVLRNENGSFTPVGSRLRAQMQRDKISKTITYWDAWIDRDFIIGDTGAALESIWG